MSLNRKQLKTTTAELQANLELSGASIQEVAEEGSAPVSQVERALDPAHGADPQMVWAVRDAIETIILRQGNDPLPYTYLSEQMRSAAEMWFGVGDAPRV